jgi:hypothetical protein
MMISSIFPLISDPSTPVSILGIQFSINFFENPKTDFKKYIGQYTTEFKKVLKGSIDLMHKNLHNSKIQVMIIDCLIQFLKLNKMTNIELLDQLAFLIDSIFTLAKHGDYSLKFVCLEFLTFPSVMRNNSEMAHYLLREFIRIDTIRTKDLDHEKGKTEEEIDNFTQMVQASFQNLHFFFKTDFADLVALLDYDNRFFSHFTEMKSVIMCQNSFNVHFKFN